MSAGGDIEGSSPAVKVRLLKDAIADSGPAMKPLMQTLLAQWHWHSQGRDPRELFSEISRIYQEILADKENLKKLSLSEFSDVLEMGDAPLSLRPTLFDFIAHKALEFYASGGQGGARPDFQPEACSGAFHEAERFLSYVPDRAHPDSPVFISIGIYQELMRFHRADSNPDAFISADISRLNYVNSVATGDDRQEMYLKRMTEIASSYPGSEMASLAGYYCARAMYDRGEYVEACRLAGNWENAHPGSVGAGCCRSLLAKIRSKSLDIKVERVVAGRVYSRILVRYRNIESVTLRIVKDDWKEYLRTDRSIEDPGDEVLCRLLGSPPVREITFSLEPTGDFRAKSVLLDLPGLPELPRGFYRVFAGWARDFSASQDAIAQCPIWVSAIALITRERDGIADGFVLTAGSGDPVIDAGIILYRAPDRRFTEYVQYDAAQTDENGYFSFMVDSGSDHRGLRLHASDAWGSEYLETDDIYPMKRQPAPPRQSVVFFTDRSVYRPGQMIHFKGIVIDVDREKISYRVVPARPVTVQFSGVNQSEIASLSMVSNDFGSFSGTFNAPTDPLTGEMMIKALEMDGHCLLRIDVTDKTVEARGKSIQPGCSETEAVMSAGQWLTEHEPVRLKVSTTTADGEPVEAEGTVEVYALSGPEKPVRRGLALELAALEGKESSPLLSPDWTTWPAGDSAGKSAFATGTTQPCELQFSLKAGAYRAVLRGRDRHGKVVQALLPLMVLDPSSRSFPVKVPSFYAARSTTVEVGETFTALWGTGYLRGRAFVEMIKNGVTIKKYWTEADAAQALIELPVTEAQRGGFTVLITTMKENRLYTHRSDITVPWSHKRLEIILETFPSKLMAGQQETVTLRVKGAGTGGAELVASLYDESLDAVLPHRWSTFDDFFMGNSVRCEQRFSNIDQDFCRRKSEPVEGAAGPVYADFMKELVMNPDHFENEMPEESPASPMHHQASPEKVVTRENLQETAFFYPRLITEEDGAVKITFTMPEALTRWHFMALAHGRDMESGIVESHIVTQKDPIHQGA